MFQTVLLWGQAKLMVESTTKVLRSFEATHTSNSDDILIGFPQHLLGALEADAA